MKRFYTFLLSLFSLCLFGQTDIILSGVFDGPLTGGTPKGIELYVLNDVADLSIYGIGSANNGGGTDGEEYTLPAVSASEGDYLYITNDSANFVAFFGIAPTFLDDGAASNVNGDDAIELFMNGNIVDVFGDINEDGTGTAWEYLDGWVYRMNVSGPDGPTFVSTNWTYSGVDVFDGQSQNATSPTPFPLGTYQPGGMPAVNANNDFVQTGFNEAVTFDPVANDAVPTTYTSLMVLVESQNGTTTENMDGTFTYTPSQDFCGMDSLQYEVCENVLCDSAWVFIVVMCPPVYPPYTVAEVTMNDSNGVPDSLEKNCELRGVLYGTNLRPSGIQYTLIDDNNDGIGIFSFDNFGLNLSEGDEVVVRGEIDQFNGLTQLSLDTAFVLSTNNQLIDPVIVTTLDESTESQLIGLENMKIVDLAEWTNNSNGFNVRVTNEIDTFTMRIDNDVDLLGTNPPTGRFNLFGIGGQFDNSSPYDDGYQILPRYSADIVELQSVETPVWAKKIRVYPNPFKNNFTVEGLEKVESIQIFNQIGQLCHQTFESGAAVQFSLGKLTPGAYTIVFTRDNEVFPVRIYKQ
jgi:hypothetical protein